MVATETPDTNTENAEAVAKPRSQAQYGIEEIEFLPPKPGRTSKLAELLEQVKEKPGKWLSIAKYENSGAAAAAASTLRAKHGPVEAGGFTFAVRKIEEGNLHALFVQYQPEKIDPSATAAYAKVRAEREEKRLAKQAEKAKKDAKAQDKASRASK